MKKLIVVIFIALNSLVAFADERMQKTIKDFLNGGSFIEIQEKSSSIYYLKSIIAKVSCNDNTFSFTYVDEDFEYESEYFSYNKILVVSDENNNIIIKK